VQILRPPHTRITQILLDQKRVHVALRQGSGGAVLALENFFLGEGGARVFEGESVAQFGYVDESEWSRRPGQARLRLGQGAHFGAAVLGVGGGAMHCNSLEGMYVG
jgi:hypothetical protein